MDDRPVSASGICHDDGRSPPPVRGHYPCFHAEAGEQFYVEAVTFFPPAGATLFLITPPNPGGIDRSQAIAPAAGE